MAYFPTAPTLDIQPDWDSALREQKPSFWISYRKDKSSKIQDTNLKPSYSNGIVTSIHGVENFTISYDPEIKNRISAVHTSTGAQCEFVSPQQTWPLHNGSVNSLDVSPSGELCVSCSEEGGVLVWEADTGEVRRKLSGHVGDVYTCRFFPSGEVVLTGGADFRLRIWSVADGSCPRTLSGHRARVTGTQIVERGRNVISASLDGSLRLWDCGNGSCISVLAQFESAINSVSLVPSSLATDLSAPTNDGLEVGTAGKILVAGCENGGLKAISVSDRKQIFKFQTPSAINSTQFLSDTLVSCGSDDGSLLVFDLRQTSPLHTFHHSNSRILSLTSRKGQVLAGRGDGTVEVWSLTNLQAPKIVRKLTGSMCDPVPCVSSSHSFIYSGSRDGRVRRYNLVE